MLQRVFLYVLFGTLTLTSAAQKTKPDPLADSTVDYDALFDELDVFLDSLTAPKSFAVVSIGFGNGFLNYKTVSTSNLRTDRQFIYMPTAGYFHKSGLGFSGTASVVKDGPDFNAYQFALAASYDYLQSRKAIGGFSYTRFFTKDSLPFYTSPLQNELYAYASYRGWWIRPTIAASYGWGSRTEVQERETLLKKLRRRSYGYDETSTEETIADFTLTASVKHDFYWRQVLSDKDYFRLTPQISFSSGTQRFGFNQTTNSYVGSKKSTVNVLYNSENVRLDATQKFQPLALTAFLKSEFSLGKFFLQPQLIFDYYLPESNDRITTTFSVNTGFIF